MTAMMFCGEGGASLSGIDNKTSIRHACQHKTKMKKMLTMMGNLLCALAGLEEI